MKEKTEMLHNVGSPLVLLVQGHNYLLKLLPVPVLIRFIFADPDPACFGGLKIKFVPTYRYHINLIFILSL